MKIYKDKSKDKSYFYYFGWTIPVFLGVFYLLFFVIFQGVYRVKPYERIDIFIAAYGVNDNYYQNEITKQFKDDGLVEVNIYDYPVNDSKIYDYYQAYGESSDFVILSEGDVNEMKEVIKDKYVPLDTLATDCPTINHYDVYQYDSISYGIKIFDKADDIYNAKYDFTSHINFTLEGKEKTDYYLLINKSSVNFDKENNHILGYKVLEYYLDINEK